MSFERLSQICFLQVSVALKVVIYSAPAVAYSWQPTHLVQQASELHTACSFASCREMIGNANSAEVHIFCKDVC
jgi:hypothetical protein